MHRPCRSLLPSTFTQESGMTHTAGPRAPRAQRAAYARASLIAGALFVLAAIDVGDQLAKSAAVNFTQLLSARAPGLNILSTTGRLGAVPSIQIRGRSSLSLGSSPLIYIDGVRAQAATGTGPNSIGGLGTQ